MLVRWKGGKEGKKMLSPAGRQIKSAYVPIFFFVPQKRRCCSKI